jgi:predicted DNA-binding protein
MNIKIQVDDDPLTPVQADTVDMIERLAKETGKEPWKLVLDIIENGVERMADEYYLEWP